MKPNWLSVIIAFLLGIGLTYLFISRNESGFKIKDQSESFIIKEKVNALDSIALAPVDTSLASQYVRNYKAKFPGGTYAFTILGRDIERYSTNAAFVGIRVYLGLTSAGNPSTGTAIITGVNANKGDLYLVTNGRETAIDQSTPCPFDCPYRRGDATSPTESAATSRDMLGRMPTDPQ